MKKKELFENMPVPQAVIQLAIPTVASCLVMVLYNLADTYFVGMLDDPIQTAAVTLGATLILAFNAVTNLFGVGCSSLMSRALGVHDYKTVRKTSAFGFYCGLFFSILYALAVFFFRGQVLSLLGARAENWQATSAYLQWTVIFGAVPAITNMLMAHLFRAEGGALLASIGTISGCLLNIVLDPFFILPWGLNMGAAGAGMATCISNCVACSYYLVLLRVRRDSSNVSVRPADFVPTAYITSQVFGVGIPASIQNLLNVVGMTVLNNYASEFGSEAVSAMGIAKKVTMIPMYIAMGISQGAMPLVGYNYSSGNRKRRNEAILFSGKLGLSVILLFTLAFYCGARGITCAFMKNERIVLYGTAFIRGLSLAQPFMAMDFLGVGVFQACGMGRTSLLFAVLRKIVLEIPFILLLNMLYPMYGLAYAQLGAELVLAVVSVICLRRIMKR